MCKIQIPLLPLHLFSFLVVAVFHIAQILRVTSVKILPARAYQQRRHTSSDHHHDLPPPQILPDRRRLLHLSSSLSRSSYVRPFALPWVEAAGELLPQLQHRWSDDHQ
ncbi:hypothetical protein BDZ85DRAFT_59137 [Elsinoe ampelina]|uniref:Uncharacterized protein n=1 Tax=Elsinoe ampelina TaxID=302913 RepID=A0A6A6GNJ0_9PEZI|nr:hypothetical protein BDZ85DRAFT_59137 [Elsinoe ampelina]